RDSVLPRSRNASASAAFAVHSAWLWGVCRACVCLGPGLRLAVGSTPNGLARLSRLDPNVPEPGRRGGRDARHRVGGSLLPAPDSMPAGSLDLHHSPFPHG